VSVLDDLRRAQEQLVARLQELEPLVAEYRELRQTADQLGLTAGDQPAAPSAAPQDGGGAGQDTGGVPAGIPPADTTPADTTPAAPAPARTRTRSSSRRRTATPSSTRGAKRQPGGSRGGSREDAILRLVAATPGITVTAAGKELGVDPTGLYRPVRKLVAEGRIDKRGPALHPAQ